MDYSPPGIGKTLFTCPHCSGYSGHMRAEHIWYQNENEEYTRDWSDLARSDCYSCGEYTIFQEQKIFRSANEPAVRGGRLNEPPASLTTWVVIWPPHTLAEKAHPSLPPHLRALYEEARLVSEHSPRASAALLRTLLESLLREVSGLNSSLNDMIGELVKNGTLKEQHQQAADYLRLQGNNAVHPSEIQRDGDGSNEVTLMFKLVNSLVQELIEDKRKMQEIYDAIPEDKRNAIKKRDNK